MQPTYTAFAGQSLIATGTLESVLPQLKAWSDDHPQDLIAVFKDQTGREVDFELHGSLEDVLARAIPASPRVGPGRPKLGVSAREITLLPQHWAWLEQEPNGASAALRRLVDQAMKRDPNKQRARLAMDAACRLMTSIAGNRPGYEEATRALYAANRQSFEEQIHDWPQDIRAYVLRIAEDAFILRAA